MPPNGPRRSVQESNAGVVIRIDEEVYRTLSRRRGPGKSFNDVLRRLFGMPRRVKWIRTGATR